MKSPESVIERYSEAVQTLDSKAMLALYSPDARVFDLMAPFEIHGRKGFQDRIESWFSEVDAKDARAEASDVEVKTADGLATMTMFMRYSDLTESGERRSMTNRLTWILEADGDDWKIIHEHTSVPLSEEDMTPIYEP